MQPFDFGRECWLPLAQRVTQALRGVNPRWLIFAELPPTDFARSPFPGWAPTPRFRQRYALVRRCDTVPAQVEPLVYR